jgi:hypothetical protein
MSLQVDYKSEGRHVTPGRLQQSECRYVTPGRLQQSEGRHVTPGRHIISQKVDMSLQVDTLLVRR